MQTVLKDLQLRAAVALAVGLTAALADERAHACDEVSDVTGYRRCSSFGTGWDESPAGPMRPRGLAAEPQRVKSLPLFVEMAAVTQTVDAGSATFSDTGADSRSFSLHNPALGTVAVYGVDLRLGFRIAGPFYAGLATRFAFGALPAHATAVTADGVRVDLGDGLGAVAIGGYLGLAQPLSRRVRLRIEAAAGFEDIGLLAIRGIACSRDSSCSPDAPRAWVEPHVLVDFWLNPSWSVSPLVGDDVLHPSSVALGIMAAWHWQGFDGRP
jgi:hypothetical protein